MEQRPHSRGSSHVVSEMKRWHPYCEDLALGGVAPPALRPLPWGGSQSLTHVKAAAPPRGAPPPRRDCCESADT